MSIRVGTLNAVVSADITRFNVNLARASASMKTFATTTNKQIASTSLAFSRLGKTVKVAVGVIAVSVGAATLSYAKFEQQLRKGTSVQATTEEQFRSMGLEARDLAKEFNISAASIAGSYFDLGSASLSSAEQMQVIRPVVKQAKAAQIEMAQSSDNLVKSMKNFKIPFSEAAKVVDIFSKANTMSLGRIGEFGEAIATVGAIARQNNNTFEETVAVLGFMADVGIRGSKAGIQLRRAIINLSAPTSETRKELDKWVNTYDKVTGKMRPFSAILDDLIIALKGASEQQRNFALKQIFGARALSGVTEAFSRGEGAIQGFAKELQNAGGTTDQIIARQMKSFIEQLGRIQKAANDALITFGELTGTKMQGGFDGIIQKIENFNTSMKTNNSVISNSIDVFSKLFSFIKIGFSALSKTISTITIRIIAAFKAISESIGEIPGVLKLAGKAFENFGKNFVNILSQLVERWDVFVNSVFSFDLAGIKDVFSDPLDTSGFDESTEKTLSQLDARFQGIVDNFVTQNNAAFFAIAELWGKTKEEVEANPITPKVGGDTSTGGGGGASTGVKQVDFNPFGIIEEYQTAFTAIGASFDSTVTGMESRIGSATQTMAGIFEAGFSGGFSAMVDAFKQMLIQMAAQLAASAVMKFLTSIFGGPASGAASAASGGGGLFGSLFGLQNGGLTGGLGLAGGGMTTPGAKMIAINENSKPEFVVNAGQTAENLPLLNAINSGNGNIIKAISNAIESGISKQPKYVLRVVDNVSLARMVDNGNVIRSNS
jgi:TP901 family phage tail tape measure protein